MITVAYQSRDVYFLKTFGSRLRQYRLHHRMTQEELADLAGFSRSYYTEIETGKRNISLLNIRRLAEALDIPIKDLFDFPSE
ncbi:helix-turn-helix domain-containing protein [Sediminibacillus dalangtanensis]|nr:helix-turn-helix transcriptional regulator [Sediminibacillus dalangtanensis]